MYAKSHCLQQTQSLEGSGCGSVGRALASYVRCLQFESSHRRIFKEHSLLWIVGIEKMKILEKEA